MKINLEDTLSLKTFLVFYDFLVCLLESTDRTQKFRHKRMNVKLNEDDEKIVRTQSDTLKAIQSVDKKLDSVLSVQNNVLEEVQQTNEQLRAIAGNLETLVRIAAAVINVNVVDA